MQGSWQEELPSLGGWWSCRTWIVVACGWQGPPPPIPVAPCLESEVETPRRRGSVRARSLRAQRPASRTSCCLSILFLGGGVGSTKWNWTVGGAQRRAVAASRSPLLPAGCSQWGRVVSVVSVVASSASSTSSNLRHRQHLQRRQRPDFFQMAWPGRLGEHAPAGPGERMQGVKGGGCIAVPMHAPYRTPSPATCSVDQLAVCPAQAQPSPYVLLRVCGAGGGEQGLDRFAG